MCGLLSFAQAQQKSDMAKFGFLDIKTDSMEVPFYIDGVFVGKHPLNNPIPVLPGFHLVSYLPPDLTKKYVEENLTDAYKRVYVTPNDTLEVFLFYDHYIVETEILDKQNTVRRITTISIISMIVYLIFQIT
ncbi:uncharacterized protein METZ01_LOCUS202384 [marine metagenome]|uniref:PEGA domain-containing protein n=1 Tax=marine metagenome TaxID=408172 RepID=A0A382EFS9_9ZZZZ